LQEGLDRLAEFVEGEQVTDIEAKRAA
jgi:hypothetical protein